MVQNLNLKEFFWVKIVCLESAEKSLKVFARKIASAVPGIDLSGEARTFPVASLSEKLKNICFYENTGLGATFVEVGCNMLVIVIIVTTILSTTSLKNSPAVNALIKS